MKRAIFIGILFLGVIGGIIAWKYYNKIFKSNTAFDSNEVELFIPSGSDFEDLLYNLKSDKILKDVDSFQATAELKKFSEVKSGRYIIKNGMSNQDIINKLRIGDQDPVNVTFNSVRKKRDLAGKVSKYLELDSLIILEALNDDKYILKYGFKSETFISMFIPDTYKMNWDISLEQLLDRFAYEYKSFWTEERKAKARKLNLEQSEVATLASIVKAETIKTDEAPKVAGLYINRLRRKMALQSDPTLIFALDDFTIRRVLDKHKNIESPYNTYKYSGLPPGPINLPSKSYLDAVLNYESHDYIFMCAKADFSGYHNFAKTNKQHEIYAAQYHRALNERGIY